MVRSAATWCLALALLCAPWRGAHGQDVAVPRALVSPRYVLELPAAATASDVARGERVIAVLERLSAALDAEFVAAGVTKKPQLPNASAVKAYEASGAERLAAAPDDDTRWRVVLTRDRDAMRSVCAPVASVPNTQGTAYYCDGTDGLLGFVASDESPPSLKMLLHWGAQQHLFRRAGIDYSRGVNPTGACVVTGYLHWFRWSHVREGDDFPAELGGIAASYGDKLRSRLAEEPESYPTVEALFALDTRALERDKNTNYGVAVLFTEFLWEHSDKSRRAYIRALAAYGKTGAPVPAFELATLVKYTRSVFGSTAKLDAAYRKFVTERSAEINARKADSEVGDGATEK